MVLQNEILNQYNPQVFEQRMWNLFNKIISKVSKEQLTHINLFNLSDSIDGILHISQLQSLSFGVVESIIKFQEFMTTWLNELSKYVSIDYFANDGNHCELRVLTGKKNDLPNENAERLITRYLKCALQNNPNITIHETNSGMHYVDILGTKVLSIHGQDERNLEQSIKDYMMMYEVKIDMLLCGHLHTSHEKVIGMTQKRNIEFIQSPSLCGINPYSTSIKKGAKSGSKMILLTQDYEEKVTYDFILN